MSLHLFFSILNICVERSITGTLCTLFFFKGQESKTTLVLRLQVKPFQKMQHLNAVLTPSLCKKTEVILVSSVEDTLWLLLTGSWLHDYSLPAPISNRRSQKKYSKRPYLREKFPLLCRPLPLFQCGDCRSCLFLFPITDWGGSYEDRGRDDSFVCQQCLSLPLSLSLSLCAHHWRRLSRGGILFQDECICYSNHPLSCCTVGWADRHKLPCRCDGARQEKGSEGLGVFFLFLFLLQPTMMWDNRAK